MTSSAHSKFAALRAELNGSFFERSEVIDGSLISILTNEHVLFYGKAGAAKSAIAKAISKALGLTYFQTQMSKFSTPEQVFGPQNILEFQKGKYKRDTKGYLPKAKIAVLDEVYKGGDAVLNSTLGVLNEREYDNGSETEQCPLITAFGTCNEIPTSESMAPFHDRWMLRFETPYLLSKENRKKLFFRQRQAASVKISEADLLQAQEEVTKVEVSDEIFDKVDAILEDLRQKGIETSDRRLVKLLPLVQAAAWLAGFNKVEAEDLGILAHSLWKMPGERAVVAEVVVKHTDTVRSKLQTTVVSAFEDMQKFTELMSQYSTAAHTARQEIFNKASRHFASVSSQMSFVESLKSERASAEIQQAKEEIAALRDSMTISLARARIKI